VANAEDDYKSSPMSRPDNVDISLAPVFEGSSVLVVDDEQDTRDLLKAILEHVGFKVITSNSATEALVALEKFHPHALVCDVGMPGEDGYSLISKVRVLPQERGGRTPAVALTAYVQDVDRQRALNSGFQAHLTKPVNPAELILVLAHLVKNNNDYGFSAP
jgi:CheY-like chemotaxis protein